MADQAPAAHPPLSGGTLAFGTLVVSLATFMNVLDVSIATCRSRRSRATSASRPPGNLGHHLVRVANAISVPLTGWLSQRFGNVRLFLATVVLFVIASLLCGLAPSMNMLILFRVIQGAVAGPMIPLSQTLLLASYPREKSGTALAMFSLTVLVAPVVGPLSRLDHRQHVLAVDLLHQRAGGHSRGNLHMADLQRSRHVPPQDADRCSRPGAPRVVGRRPAGHARHGQDLDWFGSGFIVALAVVAALLLRCSSSGN